NPYWIMNRVLTYNDQNRVVALASLKFDLTNNLSLLARTSFDGVNNSQERKVWADSYAAYDFGYYGVNRTSSELLNNDLLLSYNNSIGENLSIVALAGGNIRTTGGDGTV